MACGGVALRLGLLASIAGAVTVAPAFAQDEEEAPRRKAAIAMVLFGSLEAGPAKNFASVGLKRAFGAGGLDASGFRAMLNIGMSREQTHRTPPHGITEKAEVQTLIGYEWRIGDTFLALYAGTDFQSEQRVCICAVAPSARSGQRIQADLWSTPFEGMMVQASAYASTLDRRLWGRVSPGWALPQGIQEQPLYIGPELEFYRERDYAKLRLGLHLSGLRLLGLTWRLAGGWQRTSDRPSEVYGTLSLYWRR